MGRPPITTGLAVAICRGGQVPVGVRKGTSLPQSGWDPHHLCRRVGFVHKDSQPGHAWWVLPTYGHRVRPGKGMRQGANGRREAKAGRDRDWTNRAGRRLARCG